MSAQGGLLTCSTEANKGENVLLRNKSTALHRSPFLKGWARIDVH